MSTTINKHVLTNAKPCINETFHAPLITCFAPLHIQESGHSSDTEASASLQLYVSMNELYKSCTDSDIVKIEGQITFRKFS